MLCIPYLPVSEWFNGTVFMERPWPEPEKWLLVVVLGLEMVMGVVGNCFVLLVKVKVRGYGCSLYWCEMLFMLFVSVSTEGQNGS